MLCKSSVCATIRAVKMHCKRNYTVTNNFNALLQEVEMHLPTKKASHTF